jgi:hypothetical protein
MHVEVVFEEGDVQFPDTLLSIKLYVIFEIDGYSGADRFCARLWESMVRILNDHRSAAVWKMS